MATGMIFLKEYAGLIEIKQPKEASFDLVVLSQETDIDVTKYLKPNGFVITDAVAFGGAGMTKLFQTADVTAGRWLNRLAPMLPRR